MTMKHDNTFINTHTNPLRKKERNENKSPEVRKDLKVNERMNDECFFESKTFHTIVKVAT